MTAEEMANANTKTGIVKTKTSLYDIDYLEVFSTGKPISPTGTQDSREEKLNILLSHIADADEYTWSEYTQSHTDKRYTTMGQAFPVDLLVFDDRLVPSQGAGRILFEQLIHGLLTHNDASKSELWTKDIISKLSDRYDIIIPSLNSKSDSLSIYNIAVVRINKRVYPSSLMVKSERITSMV